MISSILHNFVEHTQPNPKNKINKSTSQNRNIINIEHTLTLGGMLKTNRIIRK